jgi:hypothetical protein
MSNSASDRELRPRRGCPAVPGSSIPAPSDRAENSEEIMSTDCTSFGPSGQNESALKERDVNAGLDGSASAVSDGQAEIVGLNESTKATFNGQAYTVPAGNVPEAQAQRTDKSNDGEINTIESSLTPTKKVLSKWLRLI